MNNKAYRKKKGVHEYSKCYLCNNKAQNKCKQCKGYVCNDCLENNYCYKCNVIEL